MLWAWFGEKTLRLKASVQFSYSLSSFLLFPLVQKVKQGPRTQQSTVWKSQREKHLPNGVCVCESECVCDEMVYTVWNEGRCDVDFSVELEAIHSIWQLVNHSCRVSFPLSPSPFPLSSQWPGLSLQRISYPSWKRRCTDPPHNSLLVMWVNFCYPLSSVVLTSQFTALPSGYAITVIVWYTVIAGNVRGRKLLRIMQFLRRNLTQIARLCHTPKFPGENFHE